MTQLEYNKLELECFLGIYDKTLDELRLIARDKLSSAKEKTAYLEKSETPEVQTLDSWFDSL